MKKSEQRTYARVRAKAAARLQRRVEPIRNAGFSTRLQHAPDAPALLLSPHPDDAVIDCWSVVTKPEPVEVVNVFARPPASGSVALWDRLARATDSAEFFDRRLGEDRRALGLAGRSPRNLPFVPSQYRGGRRRPSFREVDAALTAHVPAASRVYAPAVLGTVHPDHALVLEYSRRLAAAGMPVHIYADMPYCAMYGWPHWVTGAPADPHLDVDAYWRTSLNGDRVRGSAEHADVVQLSAEDAARKLVAMRTYATQFATLDRGVVGLLSNPEIHAYEVFWSLPCRTRPDG